MGSCDGGAGVDAGAAPDRCAVPPPVPGEQCRTCRATDLWMSNGAIVPMTRSTEPDPDGRYLVQAHHEWCPVWTGETPNLACPSCGAPAYTLTATAGYTVAVPDPLAPGGVSHVVMDHPAAVFASGSAQRAPDLDRAEMDPCGHTVKGAEAHRVIGQFRHLRIEQDQAETDAVIAAAEPLLQAAEAGGHGELAEAYRIAVRHHSPDAAGILASLHLLYPDTAQ